MVLREWLSDRRGPVSDDDHKCHCGHVVVIQTKLGIAQWLIGIVAAAAIAGLLASVGNLFSLRIKSDAVGRSGERLAPDRVDEPGR